jgi:SAM-dependent methyltransferase
MFLPAPGQQERFGRFSGYRIRDRRIECNAPAAAMRTSPAMLSKTYFKMSFDTNSPPSLHSARIVVPILMNLVGPSSVIDIGCGGGSWLQAFQENGVKELLGVDGPWISRQVFRLQPDLLHYHDLRKPLKVGRRFGLANCLEVAEHLPASAAPILVDNLVQLAPVISFSAAVPAQYGRHHVNCQWIEYWMDLFAQYDYRPVDVLRRQIWDNPEVSWWYRQNIVLFASRSYLEEHPELLEAEARYRISPSHVIHPDCFAYHANPSMMSPRLLLKSLPLAAVSATQRIIGRIFG